jgi:hypothetical protein
MGLTLTTFQGKEDLMETVEPQPDFPGDPRLQWRQASKYKGQNTAHEMGFCDSNYFIIKLQCPITGSCITPTDCQAGKLLKGRKEQGCW